ncbi:P-loop containing nucleoside triphosphate hydrolase protein [Suillus clintonianus]|uniref:P-loop containing nucleoside triphosphate hydrolase protein n=1 Tax=Suillus clintonianus TaxID=1904413 RepID=UPI001B85D20B|nr:P-loop containing nucleoside triphosphate hydrolase protein [Suillus clintonianus]KAG2150366.1 P-loop containing nucleoside triphosphate hydrolase protein [Suillus clintonianus]
MVSRKRNRVVDEEEETKSDFSIVQAASDDEFDVDISGALTGKRPRKDVPIENDLDDDDGIEELIHDSITKRNKKGGTEMLKKIKGKGKSKGDIGGGSFQSMGLHPSLLRSLTLQGYRTPTPIQRASIPALLASPPRDLVGMARTGSGKTLAYMVPLVQRLGGRHAHTFGARAIILVPARELATQVVKVGKALVRGWTNDAAQHAGDDAEDSLNSKGESLRWSLIVGGEGLDEQFEMISNNPDIIIATPGRLLHLIVEMSLSLSSVQYVVFDEADRLFELGFATALTEILARLPVSRQTLLFSATLPKSLVEFAKAGLSDPKLVRLDAESKISSDLRMAFFSVKQAEKDASLLALLRDVIKVPYGSTESSKDDDIESSKPKKGKFKARHPTHSAPHQTLVFAATKHHVEYLSALLTTAGYAVSALYGSLTQSARTYQMTQFLAQKTSILVVTDVAARGLDIPVLENVVNYDFPVGARIFVHRVGRTARAGRKGWAWSLVAHGELPYLCDLQLFLGRPLLTLSSSFPASAMTSEEPYTQSLLFAPFPRDLMDSEVEYVRTLDESQHTLPTLRAVMGRGHAMYERSRGKASPASYRRAKELGRSGQEGVVHPVLTLMRDGDDAKEDTREMEEKRAAIVRAVTSFKPAETVFEIGTRGKAATANAALMKERRKALAKAVERAGYSGPSNSSAVVDTDQGGDDDLGEAGDGDVEMADEEDIAAVFNVPTKKSNNFRDEDYYMSHYQKDAITEKGYSLTDGASSFAAQAQGAILDLAGDEDTIGSRQRHQNKLSWDKKKKKFVKGGGIGSDNMKLLRTENGTRLPATYKSGRFDEWKKKARVSLPKIGEREVERRGTGAAGPGGRRWKHNKVTEAKPLDKLSNDYERKSRQLKKKEEGIAAEAGDAKSKGPGRAKKIRSGGRFGGKSVGRVKTEIKTVDQIRKNRMVAERKKLKNARPSRKGRN